MASRERSATGRPGQCPRSGQDALRFFADVFLGVPHFAAAVFFAVVLFAGTVLFVAGFLLGRISCTVASPVLIRRGG